jgi:thymidine phosphorylase
VESIPLIASSIMSKKIAEGTGGLVLDVKFGAGAFLPEVAAGRELAETMVALGEAHGVRTVALQTAMDTVLGRAAGNALEVAEAVETLEGDGPPDLVEVTVALAREMVALAGAGADDPADVLAAGRALPVWRAMVAAQGGDPDAPLPRAREVEQVRAGAVGVLTRLDARAVGVAAWRLGAGRARKEDPVSASAGVVCRRKPGDALAAGDVVLELHTDEPTRIAGALEALAGAIEIGDAVPEPAPLVLARIG